MQKQVAFDALLCKWCVFGQRIMYIDNLLVGMLQRIAGEHRPGGAWQCAASNRRLCAREVDGTSVIRSMFVKRASR